MSETPQRGADRYQKIKDINSGSFGFVELAKDLLTGQNVAIKHIERGPKINKHVRNEIMNHRSLLHHHVIQFKECFLTDKHLCIVMEYAPGGDMLEFIRKRRGLNESEARWFFQQLIIGLDYCHRMGVASRDIKLENTLLDDSPWPMLKICDFGYSKHEQFNSAPVSRVGTPAYLAPEVITNKKDDQYDGKKADIWSCGVFLYVMLFSAYPFDSRADRGAHDKLQRMITVTQTKLHSQFLQSLLNHLNRVLSRSFVKYFSAVHLRIFVNKCILLYYILYMNYFVQLLCFVYFELV
eukprot:g7448.t2